MEISDWIGLSLSLQCTLDVVVMALMARRRTVRIFPQLCWLLGTDALCSGSALALLYFHEVLHLDPVQAYSVWFFSGWFLSGVMLTLRVTAVYGVFAEAMRPLSGLHQAGKIIFRWVGVVSVLVAVALLAGPGSFSGVQAWLNNLSKLHQGASVLTLCLLVFVCFAIRPLGLTFRSHLFGVSLGLGTAATVDLVQAAWAVTVGNTTVFSPIFLFSSLGFCVALIVWATYFALPEPERKMILLPTTSPFFFWNRISEILGDSPGHVAVSGFSPNMLAPAEIEMLTAATAAEKAAAERSGKPGELEAPTASAVRLPAAVVADTGPLPAAKPVLSELAPTRHPFLAI